MAVPNLFLKFHLLASHCLDWTYCPFQAAWTGTSAIVSLISLGWGIAAYSSALRMTRDDKNKLTWAGMILQTFWRAGMICARLTALVMLALAIHHWIFIVMCKFVIKHNRLNISWVKTIFISWIGSKRHSTEQ